MPLPSISANAIDVLPSLETSPASAVTLVIYQRSPEDFFGQCFRAQQPRHYLGLVFRQQHKLSEARAEFESALRLNPNNFKAHGNLGLIFAEQGILDQAESHFRNALRINPDDALAQESLNELLKAKPKSPGNQ